MEEREMYREFDLNGRHWRAKQMPPRQGSRLIWIFVGRVPKLGALPELSDAEFETVQRAVLSVCEEQLPAGWTPVVSATGDFTVQGLEDDPSTLFGLFLQALEFTVLRFLRESPSRSAGEQQASSQPEGSTSTTTPSPQ